MAELVAKQAGRRRKRAVASLSDQVWEQLRLAIIHGQLQPGARLIELDLAAQMGTSQGPIREALQRLERDGLVERRTRSGSFVTPIVNDQMFELFSIRSVVEGFAIRRTIKTISSGQIDELQDLLDRMRLAGAQDDMAGLIAIDMEFHRCICEWSNSPVLLQVWTPLYTQIQRFMAQTHKSYFHGLLEIANTHQPLVDVLRGNDASEAQRLVQEHIMLIWSRIDQE
jgi:DNA-binding GntR family transcriptional regulator